MTISFGTLYRDSINFIKNNLKDVIYLLVGLSIISLVLTLCYVPFFYKINDAFSPIVNNDGQAQITQLQNYLLSHPEVIQTLMHAISMIGLIKLVNVVVFLILSLAFINTIANYHQISWQGMITNALKLAPKIIIYTILSVIIYLFISYLLVNLATFSIALFFIVFLIFSLLFCVLTSLGPIMISAKNSMPIEALVNGAKIGWGQGRHILLIVLMVIVLSIIISLIIPIPENKMNTSIGYIGLFISLFLRNFVDLFGFICLYRLYMFIQSSRQE